MQASLNRVDGTRSAIVMKARVFARAFFMESADGFGGACWVTALFLGLGLLSLDIRAPEFSVAGLFLVAGLLYMWMIFKSWKIMKFIERSFCRRKAEDRRSGLDRRQFDDPDYAGPERRIVADRRIRQRRSSNVTDLPPVDAEGPDKISGQVVEE